MKAEDLIGLGLPWQLAQGLGVNPTTVTSSGAAVGSATQIGGDQRFVYVNASNAGSGVKLPQVGGDGAGKGARIGSPYVIANLLGAGVAVYAANTEQGLSVVIYAKGASVVGTTGVSCNAAQPLVLVPVTVSTWIGINGTTA